MGIGEPLVAGTMIGGICKGGYVSIPDPTYPDPSDPLVVSCRPCGRGIAGASRGSCDFRYLAKEIKRHEDACHGEYDVGLVHELVWVVEGLNIGELQSGWVGRYEVGRWRHFGGGQHVLANVGPATTIEAGALRAVRSAFHALTRAETELKRTLSTAREDGHSWASIGAAVGTSGEAVGRRYAAH